MAHGIPGAQRAYEAAYDKLWLTHPDVDANGPAYSFVEDVYRMGSAEEAQTAFDRIAPATVVTGVTKEQKVTTLVNADSATSGRWPVSISADSLGLSSWSGWAHEGPYVVSFGGYAQFPGPSHVGTVDPADYTDIHPWVATLLERAARKAAGETVDPHRCRSRRHGPTSEAHVRSDEPAPALSVAAGRFTRRARHVKQPYACWT